MREALAFIICICMSLFAISQTDTTTDTTTVITKNGNKKSTFVISESDTTTVVPKSWNKNSTLAVNQTDTTTAISKNWDKSLTFSISYNQSKLTNPPIGYGINQAGGNMLFNISAVYDKDKIIWSSFLDWNFGLLRLGSGPLEAGSNQKIPFQKISDRLKITSIMGYRISKDSVWSIGPGIDITTQVTPSYTDADGVLSGLFVRDIRGSGTNPIQSRFFSPTYATVYVLGLIYKPSPKFIFAYSPATYKGILVFDDQVASLVGKVGANGLPTETIHGNDVEIINGVPVFKNSFNQFGSYIFTSYNDQFFKDKFSVTSRLELFSNYLNDPGELDVWWQNSFNFNLFKGLSLSYMFNIFYDADVLVSITDDSVPGGFTGELGQRVAIQRQLMLQYRIAF